MKETGLGNEECFPEKPISSGYFEIDFSFLSHSPKYPYFFPTKKAVAHHDSLLPYFISFYRSADE
ncbi:hypothetical protein ABER02_14565 [Rossellomorea marisflavi]|uniref:hypothetical protein n=1 Tax=Rossellomorea marisflavi TaxID=189381 RepID=UPI0018CDEE15|nr:hypothetical protein [Rossellomorea marisflavi]